MQITTLTSTVITHIAHRTGREKRVAVTLLFAVLVSTLLVLSVSSFRQFRLAKTQYFAATSELEWMKQQAPALNLSAEADTIASDPRSLISISTEAARPLGITISRFQPAKGNNLKVAIEQTTYAAAVRWLAELHGTNRIQIKSLTLNKLTAAGQVSLLATLAKE